MHKPAAFLLVLSATGCSLAPVHTRPAVPPVPIYSAERLVPDSAVAKAASIGWRQFIADPRLVALIASALANNRDMAVATARVEEARGLFRIEDSERIPDVTASGGATRSHGRVAAAADPTTADRYAIGVGTTAFELDFWGRVRNLAEASRARYLATAQAQRAFRLSLIRQVSSTYLAAAEAAEGVRLAERTVETRREALTIARARVDAGITSELAFRQAEALLTQAETQAAALQLRRARAENALVVVAGISSESLPAPRPLGEQVRAGALASGLPSELLVVRPDVLAAEEALRAARADIGVARAAFLPSISLTGSGGFASAELDALFGGSAGTWSFGPSINLPLFDHGRRRGNLTAVRAREAIAVANYERSVQHAFREVADALAGRRFLAEQVEAQERAVESQRLIAELAGARYEEGVANYLEVLDAERTLFAAEQTLLQVRRLEAENLVTLYVALGGGLLE